MCANFLNDLKWEYVDKGVKIGSQRNLVVKVESRPRVSYRHLGLKELDKPDRIGDGAEQKHGLLVVERLIVMREAFVVTNVIKVAERGYRRFHNLNRDFRLDDDVLLRYFRYLPTRFPQLSVFSNVMPKLLADRSEVFHAERVEPVEDRPRFVLLNPFSDHPGQLGKVFAVVGVPALKSGGSRLASVETL